MHWVVPVLIVVPVWLRGFTLSSRFTGYRFFCSSGFPVAPSDPNLYPAAMLRAYDLPLSLFIGVAGAPVR
jgi:hypothetical protein